jgi:3,4-dihydroxy 2-butanone 4-phosphate synthase/GTP cyclohydrolase II
MVKMPINRVLEAIEEIKKGKMVIMMDDEDRENEGDIVYASTFSTPELVNFCASEAKGLICVSVSKDIATKLELNPMVSSNTSQHETAFTVSVDATAATTGISAHERDMTIKILANPMASPKELVKPGHIFPLIAKDGGVLERTGHTEGSVDLCKLAGLAPCAVICEIMKEDGSMARKPDLEEFAKKHDMKIVYISDLIEYRLRHESLIRSKSEQNDTFLDTDVKKYIFTDHLGNEHTAYLFGELSESMSVKFHPIQKDITTMQNSSKFNSLLSSVKYLKDNGGLLIFLDNQNSETSIFRDYGVGAGILKELNISQIKLLTQSNKHDFKGLSGFSLDIVEEIKLDKYDI